ARISAAPRLGASSGVLSSGSLVPTWVWPLTIGSDAKRNPDGSNPIVKGHPQVGTNDPLLNTPLDAPNLGAALIRAGRSFAGYSEDLPIRGFTGVSQWVVGAD